MRGILEKISEKGIVVNREVQIRRTPGQKTDIHVDAMVSGGRAGSYETLHAIIEVKGDWNPELATGTKDQLQDRYLKNNRYKYGLYLVGWFCCDQMG